MTRDRTTAGPAQRATGGTGRLALLLAGAALVAGLVPARAAEPGSPASAGEVWYRQYCASCHGMDGRGAGPAAQAFATAPTDLTTLGARHGTPLPEAKVAEYIDGQKMVVAHGRYDMPVWGRTLREELPAGLGNLPARRMMISLIVDYLATIQRAPAAGE